MIRQAFLVALCLLAFGRSMSAQTQRTDVIEPLQLDATSGAPAVLGGSGFNVRRNHEYVMHSLIRGCDALHQCRLVFAGSSARIRGRRDVITQRSNEIEVVTRFTAITDGGFYLAITYRGQLEQLAPRSFVALTDAEVHR